MLDMNTLCTIVYLKELDRQLAAKRRAVPPRPQAAPGRIRPALAALLRRIRPAPAPGRLAGPERSG